jgi:hypothetical protein
VLRFEVAPETLALFRDAMNKLRRSGTPLDDDGALIRGLGFREVEVRRALADSGERGDDRDTNLERVVRDALTKLTAPRAHP